MGMHAMLKIIILRRLFHIIYHLQILYCSTLTHITININVVISQQYYCSHFHLHGVLHSDKVTGVVFRRKKLYLFICIAIFMGLY